MLEANANWLGKGTLNCEAHFNFQRGDAPASGRIRSPQGWVARGSGRFNFRMERHPARIEQVGYGSGASRLTSRRSTLRTGFLPHAPPKRTGADFPKGHRLE